MGERQRRPSETTTAMRNVWSLNPAAGGDGWAQVDVAMRARANLTPPYGCHNSTSGGIGGAGRTGTPPVTTTHGLVDGYAGPEARDVYRGDQGRDAYATRGDTLMHAFAGMHLDPAFPSSAGIGGQPAAGGDLYRTYTPYTQGYADAGTGEYGAYAGRAVAGVEEYPTYATQGGYPFSPAILSPPPVVSPQPAATMMQHTTSNSFVPPQHQQHPQQQPPIVPDHIARAAEYEVHQMIAKRRLNPPDFPCEPGNVSHPSFPLHLRVRADVFVVLVGPVLRHQVLYGGRRA